MLKDFVPAPGKVLVKQDTVEEVTPGGIVMPDQYRNTQKPQCGLVMACGDGVKLEGKPGTRVRIWYSWGPEIELDGEKYVVIDSKEILGSASA